jgi:shikimate kinase
MADNIILIGFMGVGKGRTARALAEKTGYYTVDTDDLIETLVNKKIRKIFKRQGEPHFRALEQETADWIRHHVTNTIVSTGGGFFKTRNLGRDDHVVYLHASLEYILQKMMNHPKAAKKLKKRPLLQDLDQARILYDERLPLYRQKADLEVNVEEKLPGEVADIIISKCNITGFAGRVDGGGPVEQPG